MNKAIPFVGSILFGCALLVVSPASRAGVAQGSENNTKNGKDALQNNTTGEANCAYGVSALFSNTTGIENTAVGFQALYSNTDGVFNDAFGTAALLSSVAAVRNCAIGHSALQSLTSGDSNTALGNASLLLGEDVSYDTAVGRRALFRCQGNNNIALGFYAGFRLTTGDNNIDIGSSGVAGEANTIRIGRQTADSTVPENFPQAAHTDTYIAGIFGSTTAMAGMPVYVDATGKLGTLPSSQRFKKEIRPMNDTSEAIFALQPVTFRYQPDTTKDGLPQFGLIAEEVAKVNPDLVVRDDKGNIHSVRYEAVNAMLLNEFLKAHQRLEEQQTEIEKLVVQLKEQAVLIEKVRTRVELNNSSPLVARNKSKQR